METVNKMLLQFVNGSLFIIETELMKILNRAEIEKLDNLVFGNILIFLDQNAGTKLVSIS